MSHGLAYLAVQNSAEM